MMTTSKCFVFPTSSLLEGAVFEIESDNHPAYVIDFANKQIITDEPDEINYLLHDHGVYMYELRSA